MENRVISPSKLIELLQEVEQQSSKARPLVVTASTVVQTGNLAILNPNTNHNFGYIDLTEEIVEWNVEESCGNVFEDLGFKDPEKKLEEAEIKLRGAKR